jgi:hypothetical protein
VLFDSLRQISAVPGIPAPGGAQKFVEGFDFAQMLERGRDQIAVAQKELPLSTFVIEDGKHSCRPSKA